jgi:hypothetical protein
MRIVADDVAISIGDGDLWLATVALPDDLRLCRRTPAPDVPVEALDKVVALAMAMTMILAQGVDGAAAEVAAINTVSAWLDQQEA